MAQSRCIAALLSLALAALAGACTQDRPSSAPPTTSPMPTPSQTQNVQKTSTIGLHLFAGGKIIKVVGGNKTVVARWPSRTAPYTPPIETQHGFIGLSQGSRRLDLWLVNASSRERLATKVAQSFAVSAGAGAVAYGLPVYRAGSYHTRLVAATLPEGRVVHSAEVDNYAQPIGFVGERVLIGVGDAVAHVALWDPATGQMDTFNRYGRAGATDPTSRKALLYQGDGGCWEVGNWADRFSPVRGANCNLSAPAFSPQATWIAGIEGAPYGANNRLRVIEAFDAQGYFRSAPLPGAFQVAWVDQYTALVMAKQDEGHTLHRCQTDRRKNDCVPLWSDQINGRYSSWLIPRAPRTLTTRRDRGLGLAMWPEYRGVDARRACKTPPSWRTDPHTTAEEFGRNILGWSSPRATIDQYGHEGTHVILNRGDGPLVQVWLQRVGSDCWSVTGVSRRRDNKPEGVSASVRGREVQVGVLSLGAESAEVILGFNGREIRTTDQGAGATLRLDFKPRGSGFFLVLLRDETGEVFSAAGALLYPGLVAG